MNEVLQGLSSIKGRTYLWGKMLGLELWRAFQLNLKASRTGLDNCASIKDPALYLERTLA